MPCASCASGRQAEFNAEVNIHFRGLKNIDDPGVLLFPNLLVCLDCGFSQFFTEETELARLGSATSVSERVEPQLADDDHHPQSWSQSET